MKKIIIWLDNKHKIRSAKKIFSKAAMFIIDENFDSLNDLNKEIIEKFTNLKIKNKKSNDVSLIYLKYFFVANNTISKFLQDKNVKNRALINYNYFFINTKINKKAINKNILADVITELIIINLNMHNLNSYNNLLSKYKWTYASDLKLAHLYNRVLACPAGNLKINECKILFSRFNKTIENYNNKIFHATKYKQKIRLQNNEYIYINNILNLSISIGEPISSMEKTLKIIIDKNIKNYNSSLCNLLNSAIASDYCIFEIKKWIDSINKKGLNKNDIILMNRLENSMNRENNLKSFVRIKDIKNFEMPNTSHAGILFSKIRNKKHKINEIHKEANNLINYYTNKSFKEKDIIVKYISLSRLYLMKLRAREYDYWKNFNDTLNKIDSIKKSNIAVFFVNDYSLVNATVSLPLLLEAKRRGCYCVPTSPRTFDFSLTDDTKLNDLAASMFSDIDIRFQIKQKCKYNWNIDIKNKKIECDGVNIYQPIFEYVTRYQFTYFFNYDTDAWARSKTKALIRTYDRLFQYCEEIEKWANKTKTTVYFLSNAPHWHNAAAYAIYCEAKGYRYNMNYIVTSPGYDNYFKNIGDAKTETLTALNLTKNKYSRNSFLGTKEGFENYYKENRYREKEIEDKVNVWLDFHRSKMKMSNDNPEKNKIIKIINRYKMSGKKVYLLNGKVIFDLGVKYTQGCAHEDMSDWITHTVQTINNNKNILLLIKPHPHEDLYDLTMTEEPTTTLKDLIKIKMKENVIYLDNKMFKISELKDSIDLGIVWNGTSALEFAVQGIKTLMDDVWGHYDYPIGFIKVNSKEEYEKFLNNPDKYETPKDLKKKAMFFLEYIGSDDVRINNRYTQTSSLNFHQFESKIFDEEIDDYLKNGDSALEKLFSTTFR